MRYAQIIKEDIDKPDYDWAKSYQPFAIYL